MSEKETFDLQEFLPYLLNQAAEASSLSFQQVYKDRYGMLRTEWRVLFHLGIYGEMTAKSIGQRAKIHKTKISRAVQGLEDRRFLAREKDQTDRRVEKLSLTKQGQAAYLDLRSVAVGYDMQIAGQFSADDMAVLRRLLKQLAES